MVVTVDYTDSMSAQFSVGIVTFYFILYFKMQALLRKEIPPPYIPTPDGGQIPVEGLIPV